MEHGPPPKHLPADEHEAGVEVADNGTDVPVRANEPEVGEVDRVRLDLEEQIRIRRAAHQHADSKAGLIVAGLGIGLGVGINQLTSSSTQISTWSQVLAWVAVGLTVAAASISASVLWPRLTSRSGLRLTRADSVAALVAEARRRARNPAAAETDLAGELVTLTVVALHKFQAIRIALACTFVAVVVVIAAVVLGQMGI